MSEAQANYYAVIPANVRYDKTIPAAAKLLYAEITALCRKEGYCWASNRYFAELYDAAPSTVSGWIKALENAGYISIVLKYRSGTKEIEQRQLFLADALTRRQAEAGVRNSDEVVENPKGGIQNSEHPFENPKRYSENQKRYSENQKDNIINNNIIKDDDDSAPAAAEKGTGERPESSSSCNYNITKDRDDFVFQIKKEIESRDASLMFDDDFYPKASDFLKRHNLGMDYIAFVCNLCKQKWKPDKSNGKTGMSGLYYKMFFAADIAGQFLNRPAPPKAEPPRTMVCPVCGLTRNAADEKCPKCNVSAYLEKADLDRYKKIYALPEETKREYLAERNALLASLFKSRRHGSCTEELLKIDKKYGIAESG